MTKAEMLRQCAVHIQEALGIYRCARNEDAGLRNAAVEKALMGAFNKLKKQYDEQVKKDARDTKGKIRRS